MKIFKTIQLIGIYLAAIGVAADAFNAHLKQHLPQEQPKAQGDTNTTE